MNEINWNIKDFNWIPGDYCNDCRHFTSKLVKDERGLRRIEYIFCKIDGNRLQYKDGFYFKVTMIENGDGIRFESKKVENCVEFIKGFQFPQDNDIVLYNYLILRDQLENVLKSVFTKDKLPIIL